MKSTVESNIDIQLAVYFKPLEVNKINIKLFLRSDNKKALNFFSEFKDYYLNIKDHIEFQPIYKYYECSHCEIANSLDESPKDACIRSNYFCSYSNSSKFY